MALINERLGICGELPMIARIPQCFLNCIRCAVRFSMLGSVLRLGANQLMFVFVNGIKQIIEDRVGNVEIVACHQAFVVMMCVVLPQTVHER